MAPSCPATSSGASGSSTQTRIRETKGVNVIAVVRRGDVPRCELPTPELVLERGDRLVVIVPQRAATAGA